MNCAIIGSTKIAEVHAEQLVKNGVREITFISRSELIIKKIISKVKKKINKKVFFFHSDIKILKKHKVDYLFIPCLREIYKKNTKKININNEDKILCARKRKGHFFQKRS